MKSKEYQHQYYQNHKDHILKKSKKYLETHLVYNKTRRMNLRIEVFAHYGKGKCACVVCNEKRLGCLSLDHINDNRTEETKRLGKPKYWGGPTLYSWLKKRNYPEGYQTLCMNCQWLKRNKQLVTPTHDTKTKKAFAVVSYLLAEEGSFKK